MNEENNPWLGITKQEEVSKPGLSREVFTIEFPTGWLAEQERQFKNLLLYGRTHPELFLQYPATPEDCIDPDDLEDATRIVKYFNTTIMLSNFKSYCYYEHCINEKDSLQIWSYLCYNIGKPCLEQELVKFMYEEGIWY